MDQRVLRYAGDTTADWYSDFDLAKSPVDHGGVVALAICDDAESGGIMAYYLYESGWIADGWYESLDDAVEGEEDDPEVKTLTWVGVPSD